MIFFLRILIAVVALIGLAVALYIFVKRKAGEKMICLFNSDCEAVVKSDYSKIFGIPVEWLGIAYYAVTAVVI